MSTEELASIRGSFGYALWKNYCTNRRREDHIEDALHTIVQTLGREWRDQAAFNDVCLELEYAGIASNEHRYFVLKALGDDIRKEFSRAGDAARWLTERDRKFGVWAASACAEKVLKYLPETEDRPGTAILVAKSWVGLNPGIANKSEMLAAARGAQNAADMEGKPSDAKFRSARAAAAAAAVGALGAAIAEYDEDAILDAEKAALSAVYAELYTKYGAALAARPKGEDSEDRRFVSFIASSLHTFPKRFSNYDLDDGNARW